MSDDMREEQRMLRSWLQEAVWLPDGDTARVAAIVHHTKQQRGRLRPIDSTGFVHMINATRLIVAGLLVTIAGAVMVTGLPGGPSDVDMRPAAPVGTASIARSTQAPERDQASSQRGKPVRWEDGGVRFEADSFRITTKGRSFEPRSAESVSGFYEPRGGRPAGAAELEALWDDRGTQMRLRFDMRSDGTDWWIVRAQTYDGTKGGNYLSYGGLEDRTRTPIGEAFEGDLRARATSGYHDRLVPGARLRIDGMRLEAFAPGSIPTPAPPVERPRLIVEREASALLPGQAQRVTAKWCLGDDCWPAEDIKWSTDTPKVVSVAPTRGSWTQVVARRPGDGGLSADSIDGTQGYHTGVNVRPRPRGGTDKQRYGKIHLFGLYPRDDVLQLGQYSIMTGWQCPTKDLAQFGRDDVPGTADDACVPANLEEARPLLGSGIALVGTFGPSMVLLADTFERDDDDIQFASVFTRFQDNPSIVIPNLYIRDAEWQGSLLGDLDGNGDVDADDEGQLGGVLDAYGPGITPDSALGWDVRFDVNRDKRIDAVDAEILEALVGAHSGTLIPTPAQPLPTWPPLAP